MSFHLVECAAQRTELEPSWKLALMAFADSADRQTGIAYPGLKQVLTWSGLSRSRAFEVINELEELGLLRKHRAGGNGRRAEYVVFPEGCCEQHPRPPADEVDRPETAGSDRSDPARGAGSDAPDPDTGDDQGPTHRTRRVRPTGPAGSDQGPTGRTPSLTPTTTPQPPAERGAAGDDSDDGPGAGCAGCHGQRPCRACGTTPRQLEAAERRAAADRRRAEADAAIQADRRRKAETADVDTTGHARSARQLLAEARHG